jgi:AcrR family transcriptional regulator
MPRVVKAADVRRNEILAVALRLFVRHGYDATTVNAIIDAVGLSKGAFYHHFESKEEVMQALARRMAEEMRAKLAPLVTRPGLGPLEKMRLMFAAGTQYKKEHAPIVRAVADLYCREENLRLRQRIVAEAMEVVGPLFARILDEGTRDGSFDIEHPAETARLVMHLGSYLHDAWGDAMKRAVTDLPGAMAQIRRLFHAYVAALARILGVEPRELGLAELMDDELLTLFLRPENPDA